MIKITARLLLLCFVLSSALPVAAQNKVEEELIYRTTLGKPEDVKLLVERVGNANLTDSLGYPLLYIAASRSDKNAIGVVKTLVEAGADVNYHGGQKNYPLMAAVQSGNTDIVAYLLARDADYRVADAFGVSVLDFARQSGNRDVIRLVNEAQQRKIRSMAMARTQARLNELTYNLAFHACAGQYLSFYYESGQDPIPEATQKAELARHKAVVHESMKELASVFLVSRSEYSEVYNTPRHGVRRELEKLISNRWRRKHGVGQPGDMEKRCTRHAAEFQGNHFDKKRLDRRGRP